MRLSRLIFMTACLIGQAVLLRAEFMVPPLTGPVMDQAGMIDAASYQRLESRLRELSNSGAIQIAFLSVPDLAGESIEGASIKVADLWKLGDKKKDNGVLIMLAKAERKIRIEVGQGLEGELTDAFCSRVIRETMTPLLKQGRAGEAVEAAVQRLTAKLDPSLAGSEASEGESNIEGVFEGIWALFWIFIVFFWIIQVIARMSGAGRGPRGAGSRGRGGFWGGGGSGGGNFGGGGFSGGGGGFSGGGSSGSW